MGNLCTSNTKKSSIKEIFSNPVDNNNDAKINNSKDNNKNYNFLYNNFFKKTSMVSSKDYLKESNGNNLNSNYQQSKEKFKSNHEEISINKTDSKIKIVSQDSNVSNKPSLKEIDIKTLNNNGIIVVKRHSVFRFNKDFLVQENSQDPYESYNLIKYLGEGTFGQVFLVQHKQSQDLRALKVINKYSNFITHDEEEEFLKEISILKKLDHPNIIKIYEYYNTERKLFIVSELCTGGELFDRITEVKFFSEVVAANIMKQILSATAFCHANNIVHRDLKPENILIENSEERKKDFFNIKIIDFGTGELFKNKMLYEKTGTCYYIAPEVINNCYNEKCDLWSCGVIMYILLCGRPPFGGETEEEIFNLIKIGKYELKGPIWKEISRDAIDLISKLLNMDFKSRLSAKEALNHTWFQNIFAAHNTELIEFRKTNFSNECLNEIVSNIKTFTAEKRLQQAALAFIVHNLAKAEDIKELKKIFISFDTDGDGRLTKKELIEGLSKLMTKGEAILNVENIMTNIDFDKNGYIEYEEFIRASINKSKLLSKENIRKAFNLFDIDGSGSISKEELKQILGKGHCKAVNETVWTSIIKEIDSNSDGLISFDEFCEVMNNLVQKEI